MKNIERDYNLLKNKKSSEHKSGEKAGNQTGAGEIQTAELQKLVAEKDNGPSDQQILESPTAPVLFDSHPIPSTSKQAEKNESEKITHSQPKKAKTKKRTYEYRDDWWVLS